MCKLAKPYAGYPQVSKARCDHGLTPPGQVVKLLEDLTAGLKEEEKHKIFYQNAIDFYGLDVVE